MKSPRSAPWSSAAKAARRKNGPGLKHCTAMGPRSRQFPGLTYQVTKCSGKKTSAISGWYSSRFWMKSSVLRCRNCGTSDSSPSKTSPQAIKVGCWWCGRFGSNFSASQFRDEHIGRLGGGKEWLHCSIPRTLDARTILDMACSAASIWMEGGITQLL